MNFGSNSKSRNGHLHTAYQRRVSSNTTPFMTILALFLGLISVISIVEAHDLLSYRIQHLASGECITANEGDGIFLLRPCGVTDKYQRFNILWDFAKQRFLIYSVGAKAYLDMTSPIRGGMFETQNQENSLVQLVPARNLDKGCDGEVYKKHGEPEEPHGPFNNKDTPFFMVNEFGEYMLGGMEYTSFDSVLNPECSALRDFFLFVIHEWGQPYYEVDADTKKELEDYYFKKDREGKTLRLNSQTGKYEKMTEEEYKAMAPPKQSDVISDGQPAQYSGAPSEDGKLNRPQYADGSIDYDYTQSYLAHDNNLMKGKGPNQKDIKDIDDLYDLNP